MSDELMKFKSEEERAAALEAFDEEKGTLDELNAIRNATIESGTEPEAGKEEETDEATPPTKEPEQPSQQQVDPTQQQSQQQYTLRADELPEGYKTPGEAFKAIKEKEALIQRQQEKIRSMLENPNVEADEKYKEAMEKIATLEQKLSQSSQQAADAGAPQGGVSIQTKTDIGKAQSELDQINKLLAELDDAAKDDPDAVFTPEYVEKQRNLSRLQAGAITNLSGLLMQAQQEAKAAKETADGFIQKQDQRQKDEQVKIARQNEFREMDELGKAPEFKDFNVGKSYQDVESEYVKWRNQVATAYFQRPPRDRNEAFQALDQLQTGNKELIQQCQLAGISPTPSPEIQKYIELCELMDYRDGWRKDTSGKMMRLTKYDPTTGENVPLILPDLKTALQQKRLEEGYYTKQADSAFQKGADSLVQATMRRDQGVTELNDPATQGQAGNHDAEWALSILNSEEDDDTVLKEAMAGNTAKLDRINQARTILGMKPIELSQ